MGLKTERSIARRCRPGSLVVSHIPSYAQSVCIQLEDGYLSIGETCWETNRSRPSSIFPSDWLVTACFLRRSGISGVYCSKSSLKYVAWIWSQLAGWKFPTYLHCMPSQRRKPVLHSLGLSCEMTGQIWQAAWAPLSDLRGQADNLTQSKGDTGIEIKEKIGLAYVEMTYRDTFRRGERKLYGLKWYQGTILQIMNKAKGFNVLLKAWRNLALISPEMGTCELISMTGIDILHLAQLRESTLGSTNVWGIIVLECNAVEEKNDFLGHIGDVTAHLTKC